MQVSAKTSYGKIRQTNQDFFMVEENQVGIFPNIFLIADGVGSNMKSGYASKHSCEFIFDQLKNIQMGGFGFATADASMVEDEKYYETSPGLSETQTDTYYEPNNQEEGIVEADIAKFDGTYPWRL